MKIVAALSWYEEPPHWLAECVAAAARACDAIVAVDGPYVTFPGALRKPSSEPGQAEAIMRTARGAGIGCSIHVPREPWWGGEVEKRAWLMDQAARIAGVDGWVLRIDGDEVVTDVPADLVLALQSTELDVAEAMLWERPGTEGSDDYHSPLRVLYRAWPGLTVEQAHYVVTSPDPARASGRRILSGDPLVHDIEPALDMLSLRIEHRARQRDAGRITTKHKYLESLAMVERTEAFR